MSKVVVVAVMALLLAGCGQRSRQLEVNGYLPVNDGEIVTCVYHHWLQPIGKTLMPREELTCTKAQSDE